MQPQWDEVVVELNRLSRLKVTKDKNSRSVTDSKEDVVHLYDQVRSDYLICLPVHA